MNWIVDWIKSIKRSLKLRKFQTQLQLDNECTNISVEKLLDVDLGNEKKQLLKDYIDFCISHKNVALICNEYQISKENLKEITLALKTIGLGQWVKGHYVSLSTIAYPEPLLYFVESRIREVDPIEIASNLLDYWNDNLIQGHLINKLDENTDKKSENFKRVKNSWNTNF